MMAPFRSTLSACALLLGAAPALAQGANGALKTSEGGTGSKTGDASSLSLDGAPLLTIFPGASASVEGTGVPGLDGGHWFIWNQQNSFDVQATLRADRHINSGAGSAGVYKDFWAYASNNPLDAAFEWTIVGEQVNTANASTGAQNVAVNGTIHKNAPPAILATASASGTGSTATVTFGGGSIIPVGHSVTIAGMTPAGYNGTFKVDASSAGSVSFASTATGAQTVAGTIVDVSTGPSWGQNGNCIDGTGEADPIASCIGAEFDVTLLYPTTDANRQRVAVQVQANGASGGHVGRGILFGTGAGVTMDRAGDFTGTFGIGFDFSGATFATAPIILGAGQKICLEASCNFAVFESAGVVYISTTSGNVFSFDAAGDINAPSLNSSGRLSFGAGGTGGLWSVDPSGGALEPGSDLGRNIGSPTDRVGTIYAGSIGASGTPVSNGYFSTFYTAATAGVTTGTAAAAGNVGELISSTVLAGSAVSQPTSGTAITVTSVSLTPGDWDCEGSVFSNPAGTTTTSLLKGSMGISAASLQTAPYGGAATSASSVAAGLGESVALTRAQFLSAGTQTVYLVGDATFAVSTMGLYGQISCRRVR
jgi:hypothetical protein